MNTSLLWTVFIVSSPYIFSKFNLFNMDTSCLYFRQFALSLGKESPYIFSKFNLLNVDLLLILTHSMAPLSVYINRVWLYLYSCAVCFLCEVVWGERKHLTHRFPYNEFILTKGSKMSSSFKKCIHNSTFFVNLMHLVIVFAREQCLLLFALGFKSCVESCT